MASINRDLTSQFNRFAGKEVAVVETIHSTQWGTYVDAQLAKVNPVLDELKQAIEDMGLHMRVWLPGASGTCDFSMDRVNVHVEKEADGKYRIGPKFNLG